MDHDFFSFITQPTKDLILALKRKQLRLKELVTLYLSNAPHVSVHLSIGGRSVPPCSDWVSTILASRELRCNHCLHQDSCQLQCKNFYSEALKSFCCVCSASMKNVCTESQMRRIQSVLEGKTSVYSIPPSEDIYKCCLSFDENTDLYREGAFLMLPIPKYFYASQASDMSEDSFKRVIDKWAMIQTRSMSRRQVRELALIFISVNYMMLWDVFHETVFLNKGFRAGKYDDKASRDSVNNLFRFIATRDGMSVEQVEETINHDLNPEEVLVGPGMSTTHDNAVSWNEAKSIIKAIMDLYDSDYLPTVPYKNMNKISRRVIREQIDRRIFRSTSAGIVDLNQDDPTLVRYVQYRAYIRLAALTDAISRVHFRHKVPLLFRNDNLFKLRNALDGNPQNTRKGPRSKRSIVPAKSPKGYVTLKSACNAISLNYTTVQSNLDTFKELSPRYMAMQRKSTQNISRDYDINRKVVIQSTPDELKRWQEAVLAKYIKRKE